MLMFYDSRFKNILLTLVIFLTYAFFAPLPTKAASCHGGGGGQTLFVLPSEQNYQLGFSTSYRLTQGYFDPYGDYVANPENVSSNSKTLLLGNAFRLNEDWQAGFTLPIISNESIFPNQRLSATGLGDPAAEVRYTYWEDLHFLKYRPSLAFTAGLKLPLGTSVYNSSDPYGTNVMGDGFWIAHLGANASKKFAAAKLSGEVTFFNPFSKTVTEMRGKPVSNYYELQSGTRFQTQASLTYLFNEHWSVSTGIKHFWQLQSRVNGTSAEGSATRLFTSSLAASYSYDRSWSFAVGLETISPFHRYQVNQPSFESFGLIASYGGFY
jgi:hypothetical protein